MPKGVNLAITALVVIILAMAVIPTIYSDIQESQGFYTEVFTASGDTATAEAIDLSQAYEADSFDTTAVSEVRVEGTLLAKSDITETDTDTITIAASKSGTGDTISVHYLKSGGGALTGSGLEGLINFWPLLVVVGILLVVIKLFPMGKMKMG